MTRCRGILAVAGAILVNISIGTYYTFGNMNTYMTSYMRSTVDPSVSYNQSIWITAFIALGQGLLSPIGGILEHRIGARTTCFIGSVFFSGSIALTWFTIKQGFLMTIVTYGLLPGIGLEFVYISALTNVLKWFPYNQSLVNALLMCGFGAGTVIFNVFQTVYLNPDNIIPDRDGYFTDATLLEKVPRIFLILGGTYFVLQVIGCCILFAAPALSEENETSSLAKLASDHGRFRHDCPKKNQLSYTPREVITMKEFYQLWLIFSFNVQAIVFMNSMYKAFGQSFIRDDQLLAIIGSATAAVHCSGRIFWNHIQHYASFRICMIVLSCILSALFLSFYSTKLGKETMFAIWVFAIFFTFSGLFVLMPSVCLLAFGPEFAGTNFGFLTMGSCFASVLAAYFIESVLISFGWFGACCLISGFCVLSMVITFTLPEDLATIQIPSTPS